MPVRNRLFHQRDRRRRSNNDRNISAVAAAPLQRDASRRIAPGTEMVSNNFKRNGEVRAGADHVHQRDGASRQTRDQDPKISRRRSTKPGASIEEMGRSVQGVSRHADDLTAAAEETLPSMNEMAAPSKKSPPCPRVSPLQSKKRQRRLSKWRVPFSQWPKIASASPRLPPMPTRVRRRWTVHSLGR